MVYECRTQTLPDLSDPLWEETMETPPLNLCCTRLVLEVWDDNKGEDTFIGKIEYDIGKWDPLDMYWEARADGGLLDHSGAGLAVTEEEVLGPCVRKKKSSKKCTGVVVFELAPVPKVPATTAHAKGKVAFTSACRWHAHSRLMYVSSPARSDAGAVAVACASVLFATRATLVDRAGS